MDPQGNDLDTAGRIALWVGFSTLAPSAISISVRGSRMTPSRRAFYYLASSVCFAASLSYLVMALGFGHTTVNGRQVFWARYIDWMCTTPLILTALALLAKLPHSTLLALWMLDELMIVSGLMASLVTGSGAWALYVFGCVCFVPLVYFLFDEFEYNKVVKEGVGRTAAAEYKKLGYTLTGIWTLYPIVWVLAVMKLISLDIEVILYMLLDVTVKGGFQVWLLSTQPEEQVAAAARQLPHTIDAMHHKSARHRTHRQARSGSGSGSGSSGSSHPHSGCGSLNQAPQSSEQWPVPPRLGGALPSPADSFHGLYYEEMDVEEETKDARSQRHTDEQTCAEAGTGLGRGDGAA